MLARMMQTKTAPTVNPEIVPLEILSPERGVLVLVLVGFLPTIASLEVLLTGEIATICAIDCTELVLFADHLAGDMEKLLRS